MKKNKTTQLMSIVLLLVFIVTFLTLTGRFLYIQATGEVAGVELEKWAEEKRKSEYELQAKRGTIYDRNGMPLAQDRVTYRLQAIVDESYTTNPDKPLHVADPQQTASLIAPIIEMDTAEVLEIINNGIADGRWQVEFGSNGKELSQETKEEIEALELPGLIFSEELIRYYPNGKFASHIIGLAQNKDGVIQGVTGVEKLLNDKLMGENGYISYQRDKFGTKLLEPEEVIKQAQDGNDVYLTIDQKIQTFLEDALTQVEEEYSPERISAVVMDPKTGEILASSNRPSFNPNQLGEVENWYNDVISTPVEPGSTMKIFTWAAAIEEGVYKPNEAFESGSYINEYMNKPIYDHRREGWGPISFDEGFQRSSNVAAAKLVWDKIGTQRFLDYLHAFHFDQPTGIDLPGEQQGYILYNRPIEQVTSSFGQGLTVTPIQQMMAATAVANDGSMMRPYTISKIVNPNEGTVIEETKKEVVSNPISAQTAKQVRDLLETVITSENGTGHNIYNLNDYTVAGKTGTAQIPDPEKPGYLIGHENYIFTFLGMAPKDDPELMMYVSVKQPDLNEEEYEMGSQPVSFIFKNVMENSLHYLNIQPDRQQVQEKVEMIKIPEVDGKNVTEIESSLEELGLNVTVVGNGSKVKAVYPRTNQEVLPNERVILLTDSPKMPNIIGWSMRDVLRLSDLVGLDASLKGNGFVTVQSIDEGRSIKENDTLEVEFEPPLNKEKSEQVESADDNEEESLINE